jgi:hypothetical protein
MPDGTWSREPIGPIGTTLVTIGGSGPYDVYVGGWQDTPQGRAGVLYHSAGDGSWAPVDLPGNFYEVRCIWARTAADVYVAAFSIDDGPVVLHGHI